MAQKCVHKGCGKLYTDSDEDCVYHPGPPVFHEGQKGWKCCKPRVLTFDEFLTIPPCTNGKHSTIDDTPKSQPTNPREEEENAPSAPKPIATSSNGVVESTSVGRVPRISQPAVSTPPPSVPESDTDDASLPIPPQTTCRRRGCNFVSSADMNFSAREGENCVYHPGQALFHEGSKGWTCCKRRVLEFDEFMKIEGCKRKNKHLFIGSSTKASAEETLSVVRYDFYQTSTTIIASYYLKKIDKERARIEFSSSVSILLDLPTADNKRYRTQLPLFGQIDPAKSMFKIMGTKLELTLAKADGLGWPVLRSDENRGSDIIQVGRAGRA